MLQPVHLFEDATQKRKPA